MLEVDKRIALPKKRGPQSRRTQKQRDAFQSAILGVNDGLVSTLALLLGVAGAGSGAPAVRVAGFASLVAGACSLAVSQYIAGQTILDRRHRIATELRDIDVLGAEERGDILQEELLEHGIGTSSAPAIGDALAAGASKSSAILGLLRYGINAGDRSSPVRSALAAFLASVAGALLPIVPWFFLSGKVAIVASSGTACIAALIIGGVLGKQSSGKWLGSALRQLGLVSAAAAVTYETGHLFQSFVMK